MAVGARIVATGSYWPRTIVDNSAFGGPQFRLRRGSNERRHAVDDETSVAMGVAAARAALTHAAIEPDAVDLLLCFCGMPDFEYPKDANRIAGQLGLGRATCWSIDTACASFITALKAAHALIESGLHHRVLIVTTMRWIDRGIDPASDYSSLGDGAAAVIVEAASQGSMLGVLEHDDPGAFDFVQLRSPFATGTSQHFEFSHDPRYREYFGQTVLEPVRALLRQTGTEPGTIDWFVAHQVGHSLQRVWCEGLGIEPSRNLSTFERSGNLSAVNIPLILDHFTRGDERRIERGDRLLLFAPGAGMHIAAMLWQY